MLDCCWPGLFQAHTALTFRVQTWCRHCVLKASAIYSSSCRRPTLAWPLTGLHKVFSLRLSAPYQFPLGTVPYCCSVGWDVLVAYIPVTSRSRCVLVIQIRETVLQLTVLPFGLNFAHRASPRCLFLQCGLWPTWASSPLDLGNWLVYSKSRTVFSTRSTGS